MGSCSWAGRRWGIPPVCRWAGCSFISMLWSVMLCHHTGTDGSSMVRAQHSTAQHSTAQHSTAQHSTAQHSTAQHSTAHVSAVLAWPLQVPSSSTHSTGRRGC